MNIPADAAFGGCGRDARVPRADANLPIDDAGSIEVVRGPNSALYVRTAIGGAVNVRTGEPTAGNRVGPSWVSPDGSGLTSSEVKDIMWSQRA